MAAVIQVGSEAFWTLRRAFADPNTYKVSIEIRGEGVAVKQNEGLWTPTLDIAAE